MTCEVLAGDASIAMIDLVTIHHAYAATGGVSNGIAGHDGYAAVDDLPLFVTAQQRRVTGVHERHLTALTEALLQELRLVEDLRHALFLQREAVTAGDADAVSANSHAISRALVILEAARRRRAVLTSVLTGVGATALSELEARLGEPLPEALAQAREAVCRTAAATAREVLINRQLLGQAAETGDWFLQQLFSGPTAIASLPRGDTPR